MKGKAVVTKFNAGGGLPLVLAPRLDGTPLQLARIRSPATKPKGDWTRSQSVDEARQRAQDSVDSWMRGRILWTRTASIGSPKQNSKVTFAELSTNAWPSILNQNPSGVAFPRSARVSKFDAGVTLGRCRTRFKMGTAEHTVMLAREVGIDSAKAYRSLRAV